MSEIRSATMAEREPLPSTDDQVTGQGAGTAAKVAAGRPHWVVFLGIAAVIATLDQLTKAWLTSFLAPGQSVDVVGDWIRLVHAQNNGGLFGLLRGQALAFGAVSMVVVALIIGYHWRAAPSRYLSITLGLLLGGALGNLADRVRDGAVTDFIDLPLWPTFNLADVAIVLGVLLLLWNVERAEVGRRR